MKHIFAKLSRINLPSYGESHACVPERLAGRKGFSIDDYFGVRATGFALATTPSDCHALFLRLAQDSLAMTKGDYDRASSGRGGIHF
jgi:hypothetical protein